MQTTIKTTHYEMTPEIQVYLDERVDAIARLVQGKQATGDIELSKTLEQVHGAVWRAEMNVLVEGVPYRAEAVAESMQAAIDMLKDEMLEQLKKGKDKHVSLLRKGGAKVKEWLRFGGSGEQG